MANDGLIAGINVQIGILRKEQKVQHADQIQISIETARTCT
jgi:hypothetical protein